MKSCLDKEFKYTKSGETDIRKTFARIRRELAEKEKQAAVNVTQIKRKAAK